MEKKCSGCGNNVFGEAGKTVVCPYCGAQLSFDTPNNASGSQQIINNITVAAPTTATPTYIVKAPPMPRQSMAIHFILFIEEVLASDNIDTNHCRELLHHFVNAVYVFEDKVDIVYSFTNNSEKLLFSDRLPYNAHDKKINQRQTAS